MRAVHLTQMCVTSCRKTEQPLAVHCRLSSVGQNVAEFVCLLMSSDSQLSVLLVRADCQLSVLPVRADCQLCVLPVRADCQLSVLLVRADCQLSVLLYVPTVSCLC
jgi:hypothetical protein